MPEIVKDVRRFLGVVQYYRDIWQHCGHTLAILTKHTGGNKTKKVIWNKVCKQAFEQAKKLLLTNTRLAYAL